MEKEKERREIAKKICVHCDDFDGYACRVNRTGECPLAKDSAQAILDAGYRKADEVRKETIRWFIEDLYRFNLISECVYVGLKAKYGVEVEE